MLKEKIKMVQATGFVILHECAHAYFKHCDIETNRKDHKKIKRIIENITDSKTMAWINEWEEDMKWAKSLKRRRKQNDGL